MNFAAAPEMLIGAANRAAPPVDSVAARRDRTRTNNGPYRMADSALEPGKTCWRLAHAARAAVLVDGSNYYSALRSTLLQAERSIQIVGWDVDSRTRLEPLRDPAEDPAPDRLGELLVWIAKQKPDIRIRVLLWDYSMLFALEREPLPRLNLDWKTPPQIEVCLDDVLPLGASHHQKIVVIDDAVAFSGGLDLTIRRWDKPDHRPQQEGRVDHAGKPYGPFHDIQMVVDGDAAQALSELARERWSAAACVDAGPIVPRDGPWPDGVKPDFTDVDIGLSRTLPQYYGRNEVREVERLFQRAIETAERYIYIENQYVTVDAVAVALARRLEERPELRCIIVSAKRPGGWVEARTMTAGRVRFMRSLRTAGVADRVHLVYPAVRDGNAETAVMVHAKLMLVDDRLLRVGSANLNHRSMGLDSECDLSVEASDDATMKAVAAIRNRVLGEHLGLSAPELERFFARSGSPWPDLLGRENNGRALRPIEDDERYAGELSHLLTGVADPECPIEPSSLFGDMFDAQPARPPVRRWVKLLATGAVLLGLMIVWQFTPLAALTDPATLKPWFDGIVASEWVYILVPLIYVVGGLLVFPITVLIALTAMAFGPWSGLLLATGGSLISAAASYGVGSLLGRSFLRDLMGTRVNRISRAMGRKGVLSVVTMRVVPVAPFTFINFVAGASHINFRDFVIGTALGMAPGIVVMTALGDRLRHVWENPDAGNMILFALAVAGWIGLSYLLQMLITRLRRRREK